MTEEKQKQAPARTMFGNLLITVFVNLLLSLGTSIGVMAAYDQFYAPKIVTIDLKGYLNEQRSRAVKGEINDEELRQGIDALETALLAEPANHTVLLKDVVLRNAREIKP